MDNKINLRQLMAEQKKLLKKQNSIIDSKKGKLCLLSRQMMNVILFVRQKEKSNNFCIPVVELRNYLKLENTKAYKERIEKSLFELAAPIELRDFTYEGKTIEYVPAALLIEPTIYKDKINYVDIQISQKFVAAVEAKLNYTLVDFMKLIDLSSLYSHELAEMLLRYRNLPNHQMNSIGTVTKTLDELNNMFGSSYKFKSDMQKKLDLAQKDIKDVFGLDFIIAYDKVEKHFRFTWEKKLPKENKCRIPKSRVKEFATWVYDHLKNKDTIEDKGKYITSLIYKIKNDTLGRLDEKYKGMLEIKYGLIPHMYYDEERNIYIDFKEKK